MLRRLSLVALALTALTACGDNGALTASILVAPDTLVAYALTGTPSSYPSGLSTVGRTVVHVDGSASFDVAFDINSAGNVVVYPVRVLVSLEAGAPSVGFQTLPLIAFDSLTQAPTGYYRPDTTMTVSIGETFVILANRNGGSTTCYAIATPQIYSKVVIDSVNLGNRSIHFRQVVDPNCGYRSFIYGLPTS
ncbi:MAG TPA: hypothetical protein VNU46_09785 [Gemmatimonadaceae bacterium]|jgi:hypothetical protein|nr:hypothetical protein [Gemmatimonadaceae bacterium]